MQDRRPHSSWRARLVLHRSSALPVAVAAIVIAAAAAGLALRLTQPGPGPGPTIASKPPVHCAPATSASPTRVPTGLGSWPYALTVSGTFEMVTGAGRGHLLALQACGSQETSLRVLEVDTSTGSSMSSERFVRAAPLASSIAVSPGGVWFGESRLALGGSPSEPPYRLSLTELGWRDLAPLRHHALGRGYGLTLLAGPDGSVVISTGRQLFEIDRGGSIRAVASFPGVVVQHMALVPGTDRVLLGLFKPDAVAPAPSTQLALVDLRHGALVSSASLPIHAEVDGIVATQSAALLAVSNGESTTIERFSAGASIKRLVYATNPVPAALASMALLPARASVFVAGLATLACADPASGAVRASTTPSGASEVVSSLFEAGTDVFAVTSAGIGRLRAPRACK